MSLPDDLFAAPVADDPDLDTAPEGGDGVHCDAEGGDSFTMTTPGSVGSNTQLHAADARANAARAERQATALAAEEQRRAEALAQLAEHKEQRAAAASEAFAAHETAQQESKEQTLAETNPWRTVCACARAQHAHPHTYTHTHLLAARRSVPSLVTNLVRAHRS